MSKNYFNKKELVLLVVLILALGVILSFGIARPWEGWFDYNGAVYSRFAKNFLTFGFLRTNFAPSWDAGNIVPEHFSFYLHHPPLLAYLVAASFKVFGIQESGARIVPLIFSLAAVFLFYLVVRRLYGQAAAFLALIFFGFTPAFLYYGKSVNHEAIFLAFYLAVIYFYLRFIEEGRGIFLAGILLSLSLAYLTAWPAFYLSVILTAHYLFFVPFKKDKRLLASFAIMPLLFLIIYISWVFFITRSLNELTNTAAFCIDLDNLRRIASADFLAQELNNARFLFTAIVCLLSLWQVIYVLAGFKKAPEAGKNAYLKGSFIVVFFSLALAHTVFTIGWAPEHNYHLYYFLPFFGVTAALGVLAIKKLLRSKIIYKFIIAGLLILFVSESRQNYMIMQNFKFDIDLASAKKINALTSPNDQIAVNFKVPVPAAWYIDRKYTVINSVEDLDAKFKLNAPALIVLIPQARAMPLIRYLSAKYPYFIYNGMYFYKPDENN